MRTALFVLPLVLLHWFTQAQQYQARQFGLPKYVSVPLVVEAALQKNFPTALVDSCYRYPSDMGKAEDDTYVFEFSGKGRTKEAWFDGAGKLRRFRTNAALDTLPRRVRRSFTEYYQGQQGHIGTIYQKYDLMQCSAAVDLEDRTISYSFAFDVVSRNGRAFVWEIRMDKKGRQPNPKFR